MVAAVALIFTLSGCGAIKDKAGEMLAEKVAGELLGGDIDLDSDGGKITITDEDGQSVTLGTTDLPDGWPDDAVMPSLEHTIVSSVSSPADEEALDLVAVLHVDSPLEDVVNDIIPRLEANGYVTQDGGMEGEHALGEMRAITLLKGDTKLFLTMMTGLTSETSNDGATTQISYSVGSADDE